jgi:hypothetical protein
MGIFYLKVAVEQKIQHCVYLCCLSLNRVFFKVGYFHCRSVVGGESASLEDRKSAMTNLSYDTLLQLIEHLKACVDVATSR